jgi:hypothetical protein
MNCPICSGELNEIHVAPCFDCGHAPDEIGECLRGEHEYHRFKLWGQSLVLCDFCDADFGSYYPDYFGLPGSLPQDYPLELAAKPESRAITTDMYCSSCKHRLAFLQFLKAAREHNAA